MSINVKAVTVKEFTDWIKNNLHMTWWRGKGGGFDFGESVNGKKPSPVFKYFYPAIDMRDGKVFHVGTNEGEIDFRDECPENCKTVLDLLELKFEECRHSYGKEPNNSLHKKLRAKFGEDLDFDQVKQALSFIANDCAEELFKKAGNYEINYSKKQFTYHEMKEEFEKIVKSL